MWTVASVRSFLTSLVMLAWSYAGIKFVVSHILINLGFAVAAARVTGTFDSDKLVDFLTKKLLPYGAAYLLIKLFGQGAGLEYLAAPILVFIEYTLTGNLVDNLEKMGLPIPEGFSRIFKQ